MVRLQDAGKAPKSYIRAVAELEDFMNETLAKQKVTPKKMNATSARGLNAVKQKIRKQNREYQEQIDAYRADNDAFMESDEEEEVITKPQTLKFIEDTVDVADDDAGFAPVDRRGRAVQYTPESIFKHLRTIMESRGKKNTDRIEQIKVMEKLLEVAVTPYQKIRVLLTIVSTRFDLGSGIATSMPLEHWKEAEKELSQLLNVLEESPEYVVVENAEEWDDDEKPPTLKEGEKYIKVPGSIVSYVERLDDELVRSLQSIDPHTPEYIERLQDEGALYNIIFRGMLYYEKIRKDSSLEVPQDSVNRVVMRRLEHVYFKVRIVSFKFPSFSPALLLEHTPMRQRMIQVSFERPHANRSYSRLKSSRSSRTTAGRQRAKRSSHPSRRVRRLLSPPTSSKFSPTTFSPTAKASSGRVLCCAMSTSSPSTVTTTRREICL